VIKRILAALLFAVLFASALPVQAANRFTLLPSFVFMGEWTDNLLLTPEDAEEDKIADYSITAIPGLRLRYDSYRTEAFIGASAAFRHYFEYDEHDGMPEYYEAGLGWAFWVNPRWRLMLLDELTFFTDPRDRPFGGAQQQDIESLRTESIANRIGIGSQIVFSRISNLETGYGFRTTEYREDDLNDTVEHQFALAWNRQLSPAYRFMLFYDYNRALFSPHFDFLRSMWDDEYAMDPSFPMNLDSENDFDTHIYGAGLFYQTTPSLSFELRSGVIMPCQDINGVYQLTEPEWYQRIDLTKLCWRMRSSLTYNRTVAPAHGLAGAVLTQTVAGRLEENWMRRFQTIQEAGYTNYLQTAADIDAWRAGAGINYYVFTWLGTGLAYTYLQQQGDTADGGTQDLYAHRITLRVALATPRPDWIRF